MTFSRNEPPRLRFSGQPSHLFHDTPEMVRPVKSYTNPGSTGPWGRFVLNEAGWRARLHAAVKASGHSMRAISLEAGLSKHYLHSILVDGKEPTVASVIALAEVLGVSAGELIDGRRMSPETQRLLDVWDGLPKERRRALLQFLSV